MLGQTVNCITQDRTPSVEVDVSETRALSEAVVVPNPPLKISKASTRMSLQSATLDGVFATVFGCVTGGVLLTNFLLELGATSVEIGLLSSIPMLVNLLQPLGAYLSERTTSRHRYSLWIFGSSRLLWLILLLGIIALSDSQTGRHRLVIWTLAISFATHILGALGSASWFSWMAALVPRQLRGRYFGIRNSAASSINLICVPLMGLGISIWQGGTIQGYSIVLGLGIAAGIISLTFQFFMADVNPLSPLPDRKRSTTQDNVDSAPQWYKDSNFLTFLIYFGVWMFAVNLSAPFFNLYMLDNLHLDISLVTLYGSLTAGANLLMLLLWGRLADRIGNRPVLVLVGILVAITPLLWLGIESNSASLWLWIPLIHLLTGGTWAAIDLCCTNLQMSVAPSPKSQATYFAIAAAIAGVTGTIGTTAGGFLAQLTSLGSLPGLFALSAVLRLVALLPLVFVREHRAMSLIELWRDVKLSLNPSFNFLGKNEWRLRLNPQTILIQAVALTNRLK